MFVTRPRSLYRKFQGAAFVRPPPESPYSGFLVITDEESEDMDTFCWGLCKSHRISRLPFPQDRLLKVVHSSDHHEASVTKVWFIPVPGKPLSSNRYFVVKAKGRHKGRAYTCSREADVEGCCFNQVTMDLRPKPFDHRDVYQQFDIRPYQGGTFYALPIAGDGCPPKFLRKRGWEVYIAHSYKLRLEEARGLHTSSLSDPPELEGPVISKCSTPIVIGKWYIPFPFIKERFLSVRQQMKSSLLYEVTLKQWWEEIYSCANGDVEGTNTLYVNAVVKPLVVLVYGMESEKEERRSVDGFVWFTTKEGGRKGASVGLSSAVYGKLRWVQEGRGWFEGVEEELRVEAMEEIPHREGGWRRFGCYVLVESFVFRKMDGSLFMNFNFKNTKRILFEWE